MNAFVSDVKKEFTIPKIVAFLLLGLLLLPIAAYFLRPWIKKVPVVGPIAGGGAATLIALLLAFGCLGNAYAFDAASSPIPTVTVQASHLLPDVAPSLLPAVTLATVAPGEISFWLVSLFASVAAAVSLVLARKWFRAHWKALGATAAILFAATLYAAQDIRTSFTAIIMRAAGTSASDTNGFFTLYKNDTNFWRMGTNCVPVLFGGSGSLTGTTASIVATQAGGIVLTARFVNGLLVSTNGQQLTF
jgi:hypothetical protein